LAAGAPALHVHVVHIDAWCSLLLRAGIISTGRRRATFDTAEVHLRSADMGQCDMPRVSSLAGSRALSVASRQAWNQLPASLRHMNCVATFKRRLKTILFMAAYCVVDN